jgi:hypothetical protein
MYMFIIVDPEMARNNANPTQKREERIIPVSQAVIKKVRIVVYSRSNVCLLFINSLYIERKDFECGLVFS